MPSITMEDTMKKKQIDLVQFTPQMNEEQILEKLEQHLLKQGWTIIEDEEVEEKDGEGDDVQSSHNERDATHFRGYPAVSLGWVRWAKSTLAFLWGPRDPRCAGGARNPKGPQITFFCTKWVAIPPFGTLKPGSGTEFRPRSRRGGPGA